MSKASNKSAKGCEFGDAFSSAVDARRKEVESLAPSSSSPLHALLLTLYAELETFCSLTTATAEREHLKLILKALQAAEAATDDSPPSHQLLRHAYESVFSLVVLPGSKPHHRALFAHAQKLEGYCRAVCEDVLRSLILMTASAPPHQREAQGGDVTPAIRLASAIDSLVAFPKLVLLLEPVITEVIRSLTDDAVAILHLSAGDQEAVAALTVRAAAVQEVISGLLVLLKVFQGALGGGGGRGIEGVARMARLALVTLRSPIVQRDALSSAALLLWAALACPTVPGHCQLHCIARTLRLSPHGAAARGPSPIEAALYAQFGVSLQAELDGLSPFARLCAVKGAVNALPAPALTAPWSGEADSTEAAAAASFASRLVLPFLSETLRGTTDGHLKFHALSAIGSLLDKVSAAQSLVLKAPSLPPTPYVPLAPSDKAFILETLWAHWDDPLDPTALKAQQTFLVYLDVTDSDARLDASPGAADLGMEQLTLDVLALGNHRKGKFTALAAITRKIGAERVMHIAASRYCSESDTDGRLSPSARAAPILSPALQAMCDQPVCGCALQFIVAFLESLRDQNGGRVDETWTAVWMPIFMRSLCTTNDDLRSNLGIYALPAPLKLAPASFAEMLRTLIGMDEESEDVRGAAMITALKAARKAGIFESLEQVLEPAAPSQDHAPSSTSPRLIPESVFRAALESASDYIRLDAFEVLASHPRPTSLPSAMELGITLDALRINMRASFLGTRSKWMSHVKKFLIRLHTATHAAQMHRIRVERDARGIKQHLAPAPTPAARRLSGLPPAPPVDHSLESLQRVATFLRAVTRLSLGALYPGATHEKSTIAIEILVSMLELWPTDRMDRDADTDTDFDPYGRDVMFTPEVSEWLLSLMDAVWTSAREGAMKLVTLLPTPLPGFATPVQLQRILDRIAQLGASPRQREGDAAARLIRTLFRKYVVRLGWTLQVTPELSISAAPLQLLPASASTMVQQLQSLDSVLDKLQLDVQCARADLFTACRTGLAHYSTMMVRTVLSQVAWSASDEAPGGKAAALVQRLTDLLRDALEVSLWALSSPKEVNILAQEVSTFDSIGTASMDVDEEMPEDPVEDADADADGAGESDALSFLGPRAQVILTGCWTTAKEVANVIGELCRAVPTIGPLAAHLLPTPTLEALGSMLLHALLEMKHTGAVDKCQAAFHAVCARLMHSPDPAAAALPLTWAHLVVDRLEAGGQCRDDIVRRSGGRPYAVRAVLRSERSLQRKPILQAVMRRVLAVAADDTRESYDDAWPRVHAFNLLRLIVEDAELGVDVSPYLAEALTAAVQGLGAPQWEVRNVASLAFTALLVRVTGLKNPSTDPRREVSRRSLSAAAFFTRYPALHAFLLRELAHAAASAEASGVVLPSLCPILTLLSRLRPAAGSRSGGDLGSLALDAFLDVLHRCAAARQAHIRAIAARAYAPLVALEGLETSLAAILTQLPESGPSSGIGLNLLHGRLLQIRSLLELNGRLTQAEAAATLQVQLTPLMVTRVLPLLDPLHCSCGLVRTEATRVLRAMLQLAEESGTPNSELAARAAAACAAILHSSAAQQGPNPRPDHFDLSGSVHLRETAALFFSPALATLLPSRNGLDLDLIQILITTGAYEARAAMFRALAEHPPAALPHGLLPILADHLGSESVPECQVAGLALLARIQTQSPNLSVVISDATADRLWRSLYADAPPFTSSPITLPLRGHVGPSGLQFLGAHLGAKLQLSGAPRPLDAQALADVERLVSECARAAECSAPEDLRTAAALALGSSTLLRPLVLGDTAAFATADAPAGADRVYAASLRAWNVVISVLEDDDGFVQQEARRVAGGALEDAAQGLSTRCLERTVRESLALLGRAVARVLSMSHPGPASLAAVAAVLAARFSPPHVVLGASSVLNASAPEHRANKHKIFDRELDNYHQEEVAVQAVALGRAVAGALGGRGRARLIASGALDPCRALARRLLTSGDALVNQAEVWAALGLAAVASAVVGHESESDTVGAGEWARLGSEIARAHPALQWTMRAVSEAE